MALKNKLTKTEFDAITSEDIRKEYKPDGEGYVLDVTGLEDTGALTRAKDRETQLRKDAETKLAKVTGDLADLEAKIPNLKDVQTLEKAWQTKLDAQKAESDANVAKLTGYITTTAREAAASQIATGLSGANAKLLLPHVLARLTVDMSGDTPAVKVLGADGKASALTTDELAKEFRANKDFAAIITATQASGGAGGQGNSQKSGAGGQGYGNQQQGQQQDSLHKLSPKDLAARIDANKGQ